MGSLGKGENFLKSFLSKKTKNYILLYRFLWTWEAFIHSILISEVKDTKSHVL